jgi:hypothetical protein
MQKLSRLFFKSPKRYLLLPAAFLHLTLVVSLYSIGRFAVFPKQVNEHGVLVGVLPDVTTYESLATSAVDVLTHQGIRAWFFAPLDAHIKLYSLAFLIFGPLLGDNILGAEPFNLGCYLAILILVFRLGREVFDERTGRVAAAAVSLWPSFLGHTAQILKDPICALAMLVWMLMMAFWLTRKLSWRKGLMSGLAGASAIGLILATRGEFWVPVILGVVFIGAGFLVLRQVRERSLLVGNALSMAMLLLVSVGSLLSSQEFRGIAGARKTSPSAVQAAQVNQDSLPAAQGPQMTQAPPVAQSSPPANIYLPSFPLHSPPGRTNHVVFKIQQLRDSFAYRYKNSGTLIDADVEFITVADVLRYLPRAMEIGFLAPFPDKWLDAGNQVGRAGRVLSGAEMLAIYGLELLAVWGAWRSRKRLSTWLLVCVTVFGVTILGLGLINVGALFRMRYGFFMLLIVLAMNGLMQMCQRVSVPTVAGEIAVPLA